MSDVDDIIGRILAEESAKTQPVPEPEVSIRVEYYNCPQEGYTIEYCEDSEMATYTMGVFGSINQKILLAQRNYYLDTGYWVRSS